MWQLVLLCAPRCAKLGLVSALDSSAHIVRVKSLHSVCIDQALARHAMAQLVLAIGIPRAAILKKSYLPMQQQPSDSSKYASLPHYSWVVVGVGWCR
jgi:hypothetical protein